MDILAEARDVLQQEAKGIENLIPTLDQNFVNAVHMIMESKGRTIVTGMGKSGLACGGRKHPQRFGSGIVAQVSAVVGTAFGIVGLWGAGGGDFRQRANVVRADARFKDNGGRI